MAQEARNLLLEKRIVELENIVKNHMDKKEGNNSSGKRKGSTSANGDGESKKMRANDGKLQCIMCDRPFCRRSNLTKHYKEYHKEKHPYRLHELFDMHFNEKIDKQSYLGGDDASCELCVEAFGDISLRNEHYGKHKIKDGNLLFSSTGKALIESPFENVVKNNMKYFKTVCERNMVSSVCKLCEKELDVTDLTSHYQKDHGVSHIGKAKALIRLNITDINKLCASDKCNYCSGAFTDKDALEKHVSTQHTDNFVACKICKQRIEKETYDDHVKNEHPDFVSKKPSTEKVSDKIEEADKRQALETNSECPLLFICKKDKCGLVTSSYDNVVAHSQAHIFGYLSIKPKQCEFCNLIFDPHHDDYFIHEKMHSINDDLDRDSFKIISYDFNNLTNKKWFDMFETFTKAGKDKIESASIYFSTRCIRLLLEDRTDASPPFTLFKCLKCEKYVDPKCIESHVMQQSNCNDQTLTFTCKECNKVFYTSEAKDKHEKTHNMPNNSASKYRTVLFNDSDDFEFNKKLLDYAQKSVLLEKEAPAQKDSVPTSETKNAVGVATATPSGEGGRVASEQKISTNADDGRVPNVSKWNGVEWNGMNVS